jgi:hypothetical protein
MATREDALSTVELQAKAQFVSGSPDPRERRAEERISVDSIPARLGFESNIMAARVLDISLSGVRLRLDRSLPVGADVTVAFNKTIAVGRIRYCRPDHNGVSFQAGLQLEEVLNTI